MLRRMLRPLWLRDRTTPIQAERPPMPLLRATHTALVHLPLAAVVVTALLPGLGLLGLPGVVTPLRLLSNGRGRWTLLTLSEDLLDSPQGGLERVNVLLVSERNQRLRKAKEGFQLFLGLLGFDVARRLVGEIDLGCGRVRGHDLKSAHGG